MVLVPLSASQLGWFSSFLCCLSLDLSVGTERVSSGLEALFPKPLAFLKLVLAYFQYVHPTLLVVCFLASENRKQFFKFQGMSVL